MSSTLPCLYPQVTGQSFLAVLTPPVGRGRNFLPGSISVSIETLDCVQIIAAPEAVEMKRADELHLSHITAHLCKVTVMSPTRPQWRACLRFRKAAKSLSS